VGVVGALPGVSLKSANFGDRGDKKDRTLYAETMAPRLDFGWSDLRSWREGGLKWIRAPRPELYSVDSDPDETRNKAPEEPARARSLDAALSRALVASGEKNAHRAEDADTTERLRSLGYVQSPGGRGSGADPKDRVEVARRIAGATGPFADWADAIREYRALAALDPENPLLNMRLADALLRSGRIEASLPYFARVVKAGATSADPYVGYATALARLNRLTDARRALDQGLQVDPASGQIHYNLGEIARAEGRLSDARREYEAALSDPLTSSRAQGRLSEVR